MNKEKDISISENEFIEWIDFDPVNISPKNMDYLTNPLNNLWKHLELKCVVECCGIEAFSFWAEDIFAASQKVNILNLDKLLKGIIKDLSKIEDEVIVISALNQLINTQTFITLLNHIQKNIKTTRF